MYTISNILNNNNVEEESRLGPFRVISRIRDLSAPYDQSMQAYFASLLYKRDRQLICSLDDDDILVAEGMMQWMVGDCQMVSDVRNPLSYVGKLIVGRMTSQASIFPRYTGPGTIVLEPVNYPILLLDLSLWPEGIVLESDAFLACTSDVKQTIVARKSISSAMFGKEGLFSLRLEGPGYAAILSPVMENELIKVTLDDDVLRIDGSFALAWSGGLSFTVENAGESTTASILSKEGLTNTYRGSGIVLLAPFAHRDGPRIQKTSVKNEKNLPAEE